MDEDGKFTYLQAYKHQVGGHSSMLCLDEATVCKPAIERELQFYQSLPSGLISFTPRFYGLIKVNVVRQGDYITLVGYTPAWYTPKNNGKLTTLRLRRTGSMESADIHSTGSGNLFQEESEKSSLKNNLQAMGVNPWVAKCHRDHLLGLASSIEATNSPQNFLVLENLTSKYRYPCIIDLKMGTRQYDDCDTLQKRQSKMFKVINTTSGKLGVRIGGMQVYQVTTGRFLCRNKFYGRSLSASGFTSALRHFLHDGRCLRSELIPPFVRKLETLADFISKQDSLRLYTTSLLLLYEGQPTHTQPPIDRLKEKRDSLKASGSLDDSSSSSSGGSVERSASAESLNELTEEEVPQCSRRSSRASGFRRRSSSCTAQQPLSPSDIVNSKEETDPLDSIVDVRIIDFAHSTHSGISDASGTQYSGPDRGFLFGLENMISILKSIDREFS